MKHLVYLIVTHFVFGCANTNSNKTDEVETIEKDSMIQDNTVEVDSIVMVEEVDVDTIVKKGLRIPPPEILVVIDDEEVLIEEDQVYFPEPDKEKVERSIHEGWNILLKKHVSSSGKVNYAGIKKDQVKLYSYIKILNTNTPQKDWTKAKKLAYWMNVYNAYTVKLMVENYPLKSITDLGKPWDVKLIELDGKSYSLGDVENNILRKMGEPRIHFGINCASISCPKLGNYAFTEKNVYNKLQVLTKGFMNDLSKNNLSPDEVEISKLFEWYKADFIKGGTVIDYINKYSKTKVNPNAKITYKEYDWNLNN